MPRTIPQDVMRSPVEGLNLRPGAATLADQVADQPTLLCFLRHFGCPFCKEMVRDLRRMSAEVPGYPSVLLFFQHPAADGRAFFDDHWPDARAVADPARVFYNAFELRRATMNQLMGLRVWTCALRAAKKGNFMGLPVGDPWLMPGVFLTLGDQILWHHPFQHQGDHPDWTTIPQHVPAPTPTA